MNHARSESTQTTRALSLHLGKRREHKSKSPLLLASNIIGRQYTLYSLPPIAAGSLACVTPMLRDPVDRDSLQFSDVLFVRYAALPLSSLRPPC